MLTYLFIVLVVLLATWLARLPSPPTSKRDQEREWRALERRYR